MGTQPAAKRKRWIAGPRPNVSRERYRISLHVFQEKIMQDSEAELVRTVGKNPPLLVVEMSEEVLKQYRQQFGGVLLFEEDARLRPSQNAG